MEQDLDVKDLSTKFQWLDYIVFGAVLALSAAIGIFYGCFGNRQKTNEEFLLADRKMSAFPVALSLMCSFISANTMIGNPVEIYYYGTQYMLSLLTYIPLTLTLTYLYVPVYFNLQLTSAYQFFELRYDATVRRVMSAISILYLVFYMSLAVYGPSLALSQVTGINLYVLTASIFLVCIFYSSLGGMKAVVWTDTLQALIMIGSLLVIVFKGAADVGGFSVVWQRAEDAKRTEFFNFDPDPRTRHTFWTAIVGIYFVWLPLYAATQANIQRFVSMPNIATVRRALIINMIGLYLTVGLCFLAGLVIFARYYDCDPVENKVVSSADQLLPLFVMDVMGKYHGLPGIFVAGITSASLSSVSSGLNALAAIITEDYVKKYNPSIQDTTLSKISKIVSVVCGFLSYGFIFAAEHMGNVFSAGVSVLGMVLGPTLGIFSLGMFFPWANAKGALIGVLCSFALMGFIGIGSAIALNQGQLPDQRLPTSIAGCHGNYTSDNQNLYSQVYDEYRTQPPWKERDDSFLIQVLSISFVWNSFYGFLSSLVFGLGFSLLIKTPIEQRQVPARFISPPLLKLWRRLFPQQMKELVKD